MPLDVVQLTRDLISYPSESFRSNVAISDYLEATLQELGFVTEWLEYTDDQGERKVSLVGQRGQGTGGLAFFSHTDTVPGVGWSRDPFAPVEEEGRLIGLGSADMKGPGAATVVAAASVPESELRHPVLVVFTADEEIGGGGAKQVAAESRLLRDAQSAAGIVAEPTRLIPVYAHKGGAQFIVTAHGVAAHTSTDRGISANFLIIPFLAEMAELAKTLKSDPRHQNAEFDPPTNGFNLVINDGGVPTNITPSKTVCRLGFRPMPGDRSDELVAYIRSRAEAHGLEITWRKLDPFYTPRDSEIVQAALAATGAERAMTVPFGTDAFFLKTLCPMVVLGPGNIAQAHTDGEWIEVAQLREAVAVYQQLIQRFCM
ncbi:MAG: M20/M25/M40 family metallo-hydrolase [Anaerolineae bacterium]|nr:M20/M25/M40 family metallo-hydrolase [Anaerolineae bacterium]